jgi:hypothetical protein
MSATCPVCGAEQSASLLCNSCTEGLLTDLRGNRVVMGVAELIDNLNVAQARQDRGTTEARQDWRAKGCPSI